VLPSLGSPLLREWEEGKCGILRTFDLHTTKARYELKVVLLHLWRVNVKTIPGYINIPLGDLSYINLRHNNITSNTNSVGRPPQQCKLSFFTKWNNAKQPE
jgi:hypothetical protein